MTNLILDTTLTEAENFGFTIDSSDVALQYQV